MAYQIPTIEPTDLVIGSAWAWDITYPDHPADESWTLTYYLRGPSDLDIAWGTHVSAGSGAEFEVRVPRATTDDLIAGGGYQLSGRVFKAGDVADGRLVYKGRVLVLADPLTAVNAKSAYRQALEAAEVALPDLITQAVESVEVSINGRSRKFRSAADLQSMIGWLRVQVAIEENPNGRIVHEVEFRG